MTRLRASYVRWRWCRRGQRHEERDSASAATVFPGGRALYRCVIPGCGWLTARKP